MGDDSFSKDKRLLTAGDYRRIFDGADTKASHKYLLLLAKGNNLHQHRLGLVIAKKNVRLAAQRNRVKRVIREYFRALPSTASGMDVVVLARKGLAELDNATLFSILAQQWRRLEAKRPPVQPSHQRNSNH